jgi:hypothetical protein
VSDEMSNSKSKISLTVPVNNCLITFVDLQLGLNRIGNVWIYSACIIWNVKEWKLYLMTFCVKYKMSYMRGFVWWCPLQDVFRNNVKANLKRKMHELWKKHHYNTSNETLQKSLYIWWK